MLQTTRLRLLPFAKTDFHLLADLHSDPEVNRYLSPGPVPMASDEVAERLAKYVADHQATGFSKWKLETLDGVFIGRAGITPLSDPDGYELGYSLKREAWGRGFATEIAAGLVNWFFQHTSNDFLQAFAATENQGSLNVMQKAGMRFWLEREMHGMPCTFYRIEREDFQKEFRPETASSTVSGPTLLYSASRSIALKMLQVSRSRLSREAAKPESV